MPSLAPRRNSVGTFDAVQPMLELGIVHVRLPGQQRQRLAVAGDDVRARHPASWRGRRDSCAGSWKRSRRASPAASRTRRGCRACRRVPVFTPTGPISASRLIRSGTLVAISAAIQPPIEKPTMIDSRQTQAIHQFEIDVRDVVDAVEPVRQRRLAEAGMRRRDHAALFREQVEKRHVEPDAGAPVQIENWRALPALEHLKLDACNGDHLGGLSLDAGPRGWLRRLFLTRLMGKLQRITAASAGRVRARRSRCGQTTCRSRRSP